jgi:hypothetical protein
MEGLFVPTFGRPPMDDYHEFMHAHKVKIKQWQLYWSPNYVSIIGMIMVIIKS